MTPALKAGTVIKALRQERGLTQRQLAERARISLEAVWTIENGRKHPRRSTIELLAEALGVDRGELARA
jgi:transcriptional regulator with XRE-family HTH domain